MQARASGQLFSSDKDPKPEQNTIFMHLVTGRTGSTSMAASARGINRSLLVGDKLGQAKE